jgi:hypothetical protein
MVREENMALLDLTLSLVKDDICQSCWQVLSHWPLLINIIGIQ